MIMLDYVIVQDVIDKPQNDCRQLCTWEDLQVITRANVDPTEKSSLSPPSSIVSVMELESVVSLN